MATKKLLGTMFPKGNGGNMLLDMVSVVLLLAV